MRAAMEAAQRRARPGGPDDKQLVADGGPEAIGAAQRVAVAAEKQRKEKQRWRRRNRDQMNAGGRVGQSRGMQEPGLRRLREGARLGLFKNKGGLGNEGPDPEALLPACGVHIHVSTSLSPNALPMPPSCKEGAN
jgi:hypothetical protein